MYQINPGQARTDLYGAGKGEAQIFDTSTAENAIRLKGQLAEQEKARKQAERAKRQDALLDDIAKVGTAEIKPGDYDYFVKNNTALRDMAIQSFQPDGSINNQDYLNLQAAINKTKMEANLSKNQREAIEGTLKGYKEGVHDKEDYDYAMELYNTQGRYNELPSLRENIDLTKYTNDELWKVAQHDIETGQRTNGRPIEFTEKEAGDLLTRTFMGNQQVRTQAIRDAQKATGKQVTMDEALDYYKQSQTPNLLAKKYNYTPVSVYSFGQKQEEKEIPITVIQNQYGGNTYDLSKKDIYTEVDNPNNPKEKLNASIQKIITEPDGKGGTRIKGGIATIKLTPEQEVANREVRNYNEDQRKAKQDYLLFNPLPEKPTKGYFQSEDSFQKDLQKWNSKVKEIDNMFPEKKEPYKSETVNLDVNQVNEVMYGQTKVKMEELLQGNTQGVNLYRPEDTLMPTETGKTYRGTTYGSYDEFKKAMGDVPETVVKQRWERAKPVVEKKRKEEAPATQEDWDKKWNALKPGEKMVGLDGNTYIKQ